MAEPAASEPHLVLIGLMGAGKTTVGARCADRLGRQVVDTDDVVVGLAGGLPISEIFASQGEAAFRAMERNAVADVVASPVPLVISCGGGAVIDPANRAALRNGCVVVWLDGPSDVLAARVASDHERPLLASGDRVATLDRLAQTRADAYATAADARVDTSALDVEAVADEVLSRYEARRREQACPWGREADRWLACVERGARAGGERGWKWRVAVAASTLRRVG